MGHKWLSWLKFNLSYLHTSPWDTGISPPELVEFIRSRPPGRALDLGCGSGTNLLRLAQAGWQVTGIDFAFLGVLKARWRLSTSGLHGSVLFRDVTNLDGLPRPYELVLDIGCYHNLSPDQRYKYEENLRSLLAPGGFFLIYAHVSQPSIRGITEEDILRLGQYLTLYNRKDSTERTRLSVWLWFKHR